MNVTSHHHGMSVDSWHIHSENQKEELRKLKRIYPSRFCDQHIQKEGNLQAVTVRRIIGQTQIYKTFRRLNYSNNGH